MTETPEPIEDNDWYVEYEAMVEGAADVVQAAMTVREAIARGEVDCWVTPPDAYPVKVTGDGQVFAMSDDDIDPQAAADLEALDDWDGEDVPEE